MKKLLLFLGLLFCGAAYAGPMANVEYIHAVIKQQWGIEVPYNPALTNPKVAANMKYLLTAVDVANKMLNGEATSNYGNSEYATMYAADTIATNEAANRLIQINGKFVITTTANTSSFSFTMSAKGSFFVDWGDGNTETITRTNTTATAYSHTYTPAGKYSINITGSATGYSTSSNTAAISFSSNANIARIAGSLGAVFPTIGAGGTLATQPRFYNTFYSCSNLKGPIPENLFAGISGAPVTRMFYYTFGNCSGISGSIPAGLFGGISGQPAQEMFYNTFYKCSGLTGAIPEKLFAGIKGVPAKWMFSGTFQRCSGLTGSIPAGLFSGISGKSAIYMFSSTFYGCTGLTGCIPDNLFGGIEATTLNTIVTSEQPFGNTNIIQSTCSAFDALQPQFFVTTTPDTSSFSFTMSSWGAFIVDWGDGNTEIINHPYTGQTTYSHTYEAEDSYTIGIGGSTIQYSSSSDTATISFSENTNVAGISGSLGTAFPTIGDGSQVGQQPKFCGTFAGCTNLKGPISENLFSGISGKPVSQMFERTFTNCTGLTGPIPEKLFAGISGAPALSMFSETFRNCTGLTSIPENLFAGIHGTPARYMFDQTFFGCSGLTSIPENLFGDISGNAANGMFSSMFRSCTNLTGPSARINGVPLYEIWPDATTGQVSKCYNGATGLSDYSSIPQNWR